MRAGLLSHPQVIQKINEKFVSTWLLHAHMTKLADRGDPLAKHMAEKWEYPLDLMFLSPQGELMSKLNSAKDFPDVHGDVATPPAVVKKKGSWPSHVDVFLKHLAEHFSAD